MSELFNDDDICSTESDDVLDLATDKPKNITGSKRKWREIEEHNEKNRLRKELDSYELDDYNP